MTLVGTVKLNKTETAALFLNGKWSLFLYLSCTSDQTPLSYVPARNKTVIFFSWQHHDDTCKDEAQDNKLEIIMHYNDTWKWGRRPRQAYERIYWYEINRQWTLKLWSQTHSAYNYQQAPPFIISLVLLHARNSTLFHSEISQSFVFQLLKIKPLYEVCNTHAQIWSWSAQTECTSSQPISLSFQSHTTHHFVNVYYLAISFELEYRT